jgi:hypothetical protein
MTTPQRRWPTSRYRKCVERVSEGVNENLLERD